MLEKEVWEYLSRRDILLVIEKAVEKNVKYDFDDIFQETIIKIFEKLHKNESKFNKCLASNGYLYRMASNYSKNVLRKKGKQEENEVPSSLLEVMEL